MKNTLFSAIIVLGIASPMLFIDRPTQEYIPKQNPVAVGKITPPVLQPYQRKYAKEIVRRYKIDRRMVVDVLKYTEKHASKTFPRQEDILAVIGIESSWNHTATSNLKRDPAYGLTQIRPITWRKLIATPKELLNIENQIKYAVAILKYNYRLTKNKEDAIISYNVGYGAWLKGNYEYNYLDKFTKERNKYRRI